MPVGDIQYTARPYSSFRTPRGSYIIQLGQNSSKNSNSSNKSANNGNTSNNANLTSNNSNNNNKNDSNPLTSSTSSSALSCSKHQQNNFARQQPLRSSFYSTCTSHNMSKNNANNNNNNSQMNEQRQLSNNSTTMSSFKPLTPKLVKRIETTCTHNKPRAPLPPTNGTNTPQQQQQQVNTANKQYLRVRNQNQQHPQQQTAKNSTANFERFHNANLSFRRKAVINTKAKSPAISSSGDSHESIQPKYSNNNGVLGVRNVANSGSCSQKRAYMNVTKVAKENQAQSNASVGNSTATRSAKNYPAPLPPVIPKGATKKKYREEQKTASGTASPCLTGRRFITGTSLNSYNVAACCNKVTPKPARRKNILPPLTNGNSSNNAAIKIGSSGSTCSGGSSGSHGSPKTKKAFSTKFPLGLPFEEEFYRRYRSHSQSTSSNFSFYSSGDANSTPTARNGHVYDDLDDDEFQRKPVLDESLYVDFSKKVPHTSANNSTTTNLSDVENSYGNSAALQLLEKDYGTRKSSRPIKSKAPSSINEYLYASCTPAGDNRTNYNAKDHYHHQSSILDDDGYYTNSSPKTPNQTDDIYTTITSWAPKCSHPTKVMIPAIVGTATTKNAHNKVYRNDNLHYNNYYDKTGDILEPTKCDYQ